MKGLMPYDKTFCEISVNLSWFYKRETVTQECYKVKA